MLVKLQSFPALRGQSEVQFGKLHLKYLFTIYQKKKKKKKSLNDQDNHDGVVTHLKSNILECEVKWTLGSITMNKASRGDGIPAELF